MKEQLRKVVRDIMQENVISQLIENDPCWKDYEMVGMKMKDGKEVPNCVPKNESSINEIEYKDAVEKFNADLMKNSQVERIAKFHKKSIKDVVKALQPYIKVLRYNDKSVKVISIDFRDTNSEVKVHVSQTYKQNESVNEDFKAVVGKTIFSDGKGKLFFGYYKEDDSVHFVDYKTWAKLSFKDVSKGDTNKERVIKAILKNQNQFNKKVEFNMWAKKNNPSFEQTMDWFIQNGWISNINKGGIKESIDVLSVNEGIEPQIKKIAYFTGTRPEAVEDFVSKHALNITKLLKYVEKGGLPQRMELVSALAGRDGNPIQKKVIKMFSESVNEGKKVFRVNPGIGKAKYSISSHDGVKKHKDGSDFFDIEIFKNKVDLEKGIKKYTSNGFLKESTNERMGSDKGAVVTESAGKEAMGIAALTGTRGSAVQEFIDKHELDAVKLFKSMKSANLRGRLNFVSALVGKDGNPNQRLTIKLHKKN